MGQGRPDSLASTLKVQRTAVGSGSGRHETARSMSQLGRFRWLDRGPANGRYRRSPLIDRRHAKVWISVSQPPLIQPRSRPCEQFHQAVIRLKVSVLNLGCNPLGAGAAQPPPGRASSRLTARPARIWQARRLPRCRDSAPCFPASCAREAAAPLSGCPFSYISVPPWSVAWNACHRPSYQAQRATQECTIRAYCRVDRCGCVRTRLGKRYRVLRLRMSASHAWIAARVCSVISNCTGRPVFF